MTHKKWIKMPNGGLVRRRPDKLSLFLAENEFLLPVAAGSDYNLDGIGQTPSQHHHYDTDTAGSRKLAGYEATIFGSGSVGSHLLYALGATQLSVNIIDFKKVQFKHTSCNRTSYEHASVGLKKVYAIKQKIERDFSLARRSIPTPITRGKFPISN